MNKEIELNKESTFFEGIEFDSSGENFDPSCICSLCGIVCCVVNVDYITFAYCEVCGVGWSIRTATA